jgi:hypothetical protein
MWATLHLFNERQGYYSGAFGERNQCLFENSEFNMLSQKSFFLKSFFFFFISNCNL